MLAEAAPTCYAARDIALIGSKVPPDSLFEGAPTLRQVGRAQDRAKLIARIQVEARGAFQNADSTVRDMLVGPPSNSSALYKRVAMS
jgi:hypothetical protein